MKQKGKMLFVTKVIFKILLDTLISVFAFVAAFLIRFEFNVNTPVFDVWFCAYTNNVVQLVAVALLSFALVEVIWAIKKTWMFGNILKIFLSIMLVEVATYVYMLGQIQRISRSIYIISFLLMFFLLIEESVSIRFFLAKLLKFRNKRKFEREENIKADEQKTGYLENLDKIQFATINSKIEGRNIMISGAAGEYGRVLAMQLLRFKVRRLILIDVNANGLFNLYNELKRFDSEIKIEVYVLDIRRKTEMAVIFERHRPHIVFHAAGYRYYLENEENKRELISCNLLGTRKMLELASKNLAERFILISCLNSNEIFVKRIKKREEEITRLARKKSNTRFSIYSFEFGDDIKDEIDSVAEKTFEIFTQKEEGTVVE
ncbi:MAG: polysaccharide biosynthesis protein [Candidatus Fimenecus sp.]